MLAPRTIAAYESELETIRSSGLYKRERIIDSPQGPAISVGGKTVLNFCANNYLGLSNSPVLKAAAKEGIESFGLGLSSVRFICGTQSIHKTLEKKISAFLGKDDTILYTSCWDANGGVFEILLGEKDAVISDALNHASIIDGIRLCKASRYRYAHNDLNDLEKQLTDARAKGCERLLVVTDGVFSMDGEVAPLKEIVALVKRFEALLMVDDSHATGFFGPTGRGSIEHCDVMGDVDIVTSTMGKALGGGVGGFTASYGPCVDLLRQRSRPYLFSNSVPPALVMSTIACLDLISKSTELRDKLADNTRHWRAGITQLGFTVKGDVHPITPIMIGDAKLATLVADDLLKEGIYVIGFSYPVVPHGQARIRTQISAGHSREDLDRALAAFAKVGRAHGIIS